ncbi:MAG: hypothetical protein ACFFDF_03795 [Candidatus Odinarchaeota archaeon]
MNFNRFEIETTPEIIYTQNKANGIGKLYINGKQITGLIEIEIKAETKRDTITSPLELKIKRVKKNEFDNTIIPKGFENSIMEELYGLDK